MKQRLNGKILQARLALAWETLWNAALPAVLVLLAFTAAVLSGLLANLPDIVRYVALALSVGAFLWSLRSFIGLKWPGRDAAVRRIEQQSHLEHRPVNAALDRLADPEPNPLSASIWEAHKLRQLASLKNLKVGVPRSGWSIADPYAMRLPLGLALLASLFLYRGDPVGQFADALRMVPAVPAVTVSLDAWIKPPAYTAKPPVMLTSKATIERLAVNPELLVPEMSVLTVRVHNASKPHLAFYELLPSGQPGAELKDQTPPLKMDGQAAQVEIKLARPMHVKVFDGSTELSSWQVALIPDANPLIGFTRDPYADDSRLALAWKAADDYGLANVETEISLSDVQEGEIGIAGNGVFLFDAPQFPIVLKKTSAREAAATTLNDLTAHPWAGLNVDVVLKARDIGGRSGESELKSIKLPERQFLKPLARALVEQRKALVMDPDETTPVQRMLRALLTYPDGLIEKSGHHIAIRTVMSRIAHTENHDDIRDAIDMLWKIAISIEEGDITDARAALDALRKELERALAEGASPERIAELMSKMREAMDRYLEQMMAEAQRQLQQNQGAQQNQQRRNQQGRQISPKDLQKMLDTIEKLAQNGANEAAQELLSQLEEILRNLQAGVPQQLDQQGESQLGQMLDELTEMMRRQQQLMDETQRLPNGMEGEMGEQPEGREPGARGRPMPGDLADQQKALERMLQEMMDQMGQNGMRPPNALGEAGKEMEGAAGALGKGERDQALGNQGEALNQLRQGAQGMAQQMQQQQGMGNEGNYGRHGEARGDDRDPLGRPLPTQGEDVGPDRDMLPSEQAIRRAREILEMLRSRSNAADLPRLERDYFERLLRGLY